MNTLLEFWWVIPSLITLIAVGSACFAPTSNGLYQWVEFIENLKAALFISALSWGALIGLFGVK